jgi:hypothetical protein
MPTLAITKGYADGDVLLEADLDNIRDALLTFMNTTKINSDNIQDDGINATKINADESTIDGTGTTLAVKSAGITATQLAAGAVVEAKIGAGAVTETKLGNGAVANAKLATDAVTSDKIAAGAVATVDIADSAVTAAKIAAAVAGDGLAGGGGTALSVNVDATTIEISADTLQVKDGGITNAKLGGGAVQAGNIANGAVNTSDIAAGAVTRAKLEAVGQQVSSSSGTYTRSTASFAAVTNLSVSITTAGRPVMVTMQAEGGGAVSSIASSGGTGGFIQVKRDSTDIGQYEVNTLNVPGFIGILDTPTSGTYTYTINAKGDGTNNLSITNMVLVAYEL